VLPRAAVLAVLVVAALPAVAQAEAITIQVTSVVVKITAKDVRPKGTSKGDRVVQRNKLLNAVKQFAKGKGARVGTDIGTTTFTGAHSARYEGTTQLPDGTIKVKGDVRLILGGGIQIPIVGGTGRYEGAKGMLYVAAGEDRVLNVYQLVVPSPAA
jgi:hypothetical protein